MPIPGAELAIVELSKVSDYLLNERHPVGASKARWFISLGYSPQRPEELADALCRFVTENDGDEGQISPFGIKYQVRGFLDSPTGKPGKIHTVWITEDGQPAPRLVTAYPDKSL